MPQSNGSRHAIVSSGPNSINVEAFWWVVVNENVTLIACLARDIGKECIEYWPKDKPVKFGEYKISLKSKSE